MKIAAFGDSFIFGNELQDIPELFPVGYNFSKSSKLTYPALLATKLKLDYQCYAYPGVGNQWLLNQIISCIKQNKNQVLYIINWTWIDRFDYHDKDKNDYHKWSTVRPSLDNQTVDKFYYKNLHSELLDKTLSLGQIYQAICALESNSCKYLMTYMDNLIFDTQWHAPENILFLQNQIKNKLYNYNGKNFIDWAKVNGYDFGRYNHPLEQAHAAAGELMIKVFDTQNTNVR